MDVPRLQVTVFASASPTTDAKYVDASARFGRALAAARCLCVNGGGNAGCMGALNEAAKASGCRVRGVIHSMWIGEEDAKGLDELIVVGGTDLTERKRRLLEDADVLVALPGGVGTLDEFFEAVAAVHTRLSTLPIVLVNVDGYYDGTIAQLDRARRDGLLSKAWRGEGGGGDGGLLHVAPTPEEAAAFCVRRIAATHTLALRGGPPGASPQTRAEAALGALLQLEGVGGGEVAAARAGEAVLRVSGGVSPAALVEAVTRLGYEATWQGARATARPNERHARWKVEDFWRGAIAGAAGAAAAGGLLLLLALRARRAA